MKHVVFAAVLTLGFAGAAWAEGDLASVEVPAAAAMVSTASATADRGSEGTPDFNSDATRTMANAPRGENGSDATPDFTGKAMSVGSPDVGIAQTGENGPRG